MISISYIWYLFVRSKDLFMPSMVNPLRLNEHSATVSTSSLSSYSTLQLERLWTTSVIACDSSFGEDEYMTENHRDMDVSFLRRKLDKINRVLDQTSTPCRLHTLTFVSRLIFTVLTTGILLVPGRLIPESESQTYRSGLSFGEITWLCLSIGNLVELLYPLPKHPRSQSLLLPTLSLLFLPFPNIRIYAYPSLTVSLPFLYFSLITPSSPSFAHVFPNVYLPFTTYASSVIHRSFRPMILLAPLALLVFFALALGLNGDLWRIGLAFVSFLYTVLSFGMKSDTETSGEESGSTPTPADPGVAPFAVRLWLSITLVAILWVMVVVGCAGGMTAGQIGDPSSSPFPTSASSGDGHIESQVGGEERWENEWGKRTGLEAKRIRKRTIQGWVPSLQSDPSVYPDSRLSFEENDGEAGVIAFREAHRQGSLMVRFPSPFNIIHFVLYSIPSFLFSTLWLADASHSAQTRQGLDSWGRSLNRTLVRLLGGLAFGWWDGAWWVWGKLRGEESERTRGEIELRGD